MFLILGLLLFQLGLVVKTQIVVTHSVREGARAIVGQEFNLKQAQADAETAIFQSTGLDPQKTQVSIKKLSSNLAEIKVLFKTTILIPPINKFVSNITIQSSLKVPIS